MTPVVSGGIMSYVGGVLSGRFMKSLDGGVAGNAGMSCLSSVISVIILIPLMLISPSYQTFGGHMQNNRSVCPS